MKLTDLFESSGETLTGIHFSSKAGLTKLLSSKHGTGITSSERKRAKEYPESFIKNRVYFYSDKELNSGSVKSEFGANSNRYTAVLKNVYDGDVDPLKLFTKAKEEEGVVSPLLTANLFENLVVEGGFSGYIKFGIIIYFKDVEVKSPLI